MYFSLILCVSVVNFYENRDWGSVGVCTVHGMESWGSDGGCRVVEERRALLVERVWISAALFPRRPAWVSNVIVVRLHSTPAAHSYMCVT